MMHLSIYRILVIITLSQGLVFAEKIKEETLQFSFTKKPLIEVVTDLAEKQRLILLLPQGADLDALKTQKVTYTPANDHPVTPKKAWDVITTFLEMSGFSLAKRNNQTYAIVRNSSVEGGAATREILPLYVSPKQEALPASDERVRAIIYLKNVKVPALAERESHPLTKLLKDLGSKDALFAYEPRSNGLIITDRAFHVASLINLIDHFDKRGTTEEIAYVPLAYVKATDVERIFDSLKKALPETGPAEGQRPISGDAVSDSASYFSKDTTILADTMRNGIILMGNSNHLERITEFITDSLDVPQEKGESILHSYDLQYLDAMTFAAELQKIVSSVIMNGQATQAPLRRGQEHFFKGVQIVAEGEVQEKIERPTEWPAYDQKGFPELKGIEGTTFRGGNRLIIAARQDDWKIIKEFIQKLDTPKMQVVLEVMIVDFTYDHIAKTGSALRTKSDSDLLPHGVKFLSDHLAPVSSILGTNPVDLAQDLLAAVGPESAVRGIQPGSLLISFNDRSTPGIFGLLQILERVLNTKVRSYPYLVITNNQKGIVESEELRRTTGDLVTAQFGNYTIPIVDVPATIKVVASPHIVSEDRVRLDIGFTIDTFEGRTFNRLTKGLKTTATLASGQILAMGGLMRIDRDEVVTTTPFLGHIPIIGLFFSGTRVEAKRTNLTLFVSPTIIKPANRRLLTEKTLKKIEEIRGGDMPLYDDRDPVVHFLFSQPPNSTFNNYFADTANLDNLRELSCNGNKLYMIPEEQREQAQPTSRRHIFRCLHPTPKSITQHVAPRLPTIKQVSVSEIINNKAELPEWAGPQSSMDRLKTILAKCDEPFLAHREASL